MTWPDSVSPLDLPDFETQARRLRYQSLGTACRETSIEWLLLAHHNDDQAETVLMRLASGQKGPGLRGMRAQAPIPECWGMHGVHMSGSRDIVTSRLSELEKKGRRAQRLRDALDEPDLFEGGGVFILRPLLSFSKDRLIETCRARALPWEEDKTNEDTWRTPRNSVRALLRSDKLPQALLKDSMLQLSRQIYDDVSYKTAIVRNILRRCELLLFDVRCGGLVVRLPSGMTKAEKSTRGDNSIYRRKARLTTILFLKFLVSSITPQEEVSLQSLEQAMVSIFPDLEHRGNMCRETLQPTNFTTSGVQFQRLHYPLAAPRSKMDPDFRRQLEDLDPFFVWKLTRQPYSESPPSFMVQPSATLDFSVAGNSSSWSSWQLWDGRYWIRLLNRSHLPLIVRSFQASDLQHLRSTLSRQRYEEFHQFLHLTVPGKVRWTLLAVAEIENETLPMGRLIALPTLGRAGTFDTRDTIDTNHVEWQIRYKRVQLGYWISDDSGSRIRRNRDLYTSWED